MDHRTHEDRGREQSPRRRGARRSKFVDFYGELIARGGRLHVDDYRRLGARYGLSGRRLNQIAAGRCPGVSRDGDFREITEYGRKRA
jgi:hypothetical protein